MKRKRKKTETQKLMDEAIRVHSLFIRERDNYTCFVCGFKGDRTTIDNGHLIKRGKKAVLFDDMNCNAQCKACNEKHNHWPEHYTSKWVLKYGVEAYQDLIRRSIPLKHWKNYELQEIIDRCKQ